MVTCIRNSGSEYHPVTGTGVSGFSLFVIYLNILPAQSTYFLAERKLAIFSLKSSSIIAAHTNHKGEQYEKNKIDFNLIDRLDIQNIFGIIFVSQVQIFLINPKCWVVGLLSMLNPFNLKYR